MKTFTATVHHLGFYWPTEREDYARTVISFTTKDVEGLYGKKEATDENLAEVVFDLSGNPSKSPTIVSRSHGAYTVSVGDVVAIEKENKEKKYWLCCSQGWLELRRSEISYLAGKVEQAAESYGGRWEVGYKGPEAIMRRREIQDRKLAGKGAGVHKDED